MRELTAVMLGKKIKEKEISVREAVEASFEQIEKLEDELHCFVTAEKEKALKKADIIQKK